jgi:hypothetical protein
MWSILEERHPTFFTRLRCIKSLAEKGGQLTRLTTKAEAKDGAVDVVQVEELVNSTAATSSILQVSYFNVMMITEDLFFKWRKIFRI